MLKWAIAKEDRRDARNQCQSSSSNSQQSNSSSNNSSPCISTSNSTKSLLRKRRKLSHSSLLGKGGEVELISGTKNRNQSSNDGGCYLKQHHHPQPQPSWGINSTANSNLNNDSGGLGGPHCPSPTPSNTCNKKQHQSAKPKTASHKIRNDSNNCIINTSVSFNNNNNNNDPSNCGTNADSKSLLYMSLDHLPLAIVKQYERMLRDQEDNGDTNNNHNSGSHSQRYDPVTKVHERNEDEVVPGKQSLPGTGTGTGAGKAGGRKKDKKCLSFATSTLPSRSLFKSKSIQSQKKIILPLHGVTTTTSAGTTKSLQSATKLVKQPKIVSNNKRVATAEQQTSETTAKEGVTVAAAMTDSRQPQVVVASTSTSVSSPSLSPSPSSVSISASVGSGGADIIRHARSRSLRTSSSFKTKVNEEDNAKNPQTNNSAVTANPPYIYSANNSHKSSTLPRARTQQQQHKTQTLQKSLTVNNNHKSISILSSSDAHVKQQSNQSTQTFKSILKNKSSLELNNNNFTTANQNSPTIENLDLLSSPLRRPFQSLLNVSTECNPPTPSATPTSSLHQRKTNTTQSKNKLMKTNQDDEEDGEVVRNEVQLVESADVDVDIDTETERRDVIRRPRPALDAFRYHGLEVERVAGLGRLVGVEETSEATKEQELDHDTTDPQFLENSLTFSFPAVARCAKKLTLKRSELRKLERIRSQTDRLNRFLRKYYHECLPNLPEEEVSQCSPEEKSVSILRTHWTEDKKLPRSHSKRLGTALHTLDEENLTDLFNSTGTTTSSSSVSGSTEDSSSGSSTCSSSSSSSDLDWKGYCILNGNGKSHTGSGREHGGHRHNNHSSSSSSCGSSRKTRSRQKRHSRSVLSNNETTLLPIIQEDSAEVSSASVKSLESQSHSQNGREIADNQRQHNSTDAHSSHSRSKGASSLASTFPMTAGRDTCPGGDTSNLSRNDDDDHSIAVKRDNMGDVKDHSRDLFSRNAFVTEGAATDLRKLKGSLKRDSDEPFDLPTRPNSNPNPALLTALPFAEGNLRNPQLGFTLIAPHPASSLPLTGPGEMSFPVNETVCCISTDSHSTASSCGSHSHGYGSATTNETNRTDKSDPDGYVSSHQNGHGHGPGPIVSILTSTSTPSNRQTQNEGNQKRDDHLDDYDESERDSLPDDGNSSRATISTAISSTNTNANYPSETENETWNSHEYPSGSPCESSDDQVQDQDTNFVLVTGNSSTFDSSQHPQQCELTQRQISSPLSSRPPPTVINKTKETDWSKSHPQNDKAYCEHDEMPLTMMSSLSPPLPAPSFDSACDSQPPLVHGSTDSVTDSDGDVDDEEDEGAPDKNEDESLDDEDHESKKASGHGSVLSTPIRRLMKTPMKKSTPRKLVRKPPVKSIFSGKGEVLIRTYSNGDYVTLHVVHAKNLQASYRSSWKLAIKISLLPEAEATFTKSESVEVCKNRTGVKIDQKFSFEISKSQNLEQKVFLTFWKRLDKKTSFLGWTTLSLSLLSSTWSQSQSQKSRSIQTNQSTSTSYNNNNKGKSKGLDCWFKLRKRKMSSASTSTYTPAAYNSAKMNGNSNVNNNNNNNNNNHRRTSSSSSSASSSKPSPLPLEIETLEEIQSPDTHDPDEAHTDSHSHFHHHHHPDEIKSQFPNSSTMDSGVEDCCEPAVVQPSIELDETQGKRVRVKMLKQENMGFGFSVVWVSPPRIERLEKDKTADLAGLRIGDLIIGVNGEDVTTVPNTTIYHNMKTTGSELDLEVWRKNPPAPTPANVVKSNNGPQIGSMVMMLMTGSGSGHPPKVTNSPKPTPSHHQQQQQQQHVANTAVSSPRHTKPPSSSSAPHQTASSTQKPNGNNNNASMSHDDNSNHHHHHDQHNHHHHHHHHEQQQQQHPQQQRPPQAPQTQLPPQTSTATTTTSHLTHNNNHASSSAGLCNNNNPPFKVQLPPVSILKPAPPAPPSGAAPPSPLISSHNHLQRQAMMTKKLPTHPQPTLASSSWKIRFNVEVGQGTIV